MPNEIRNYRTERREETYQRLLQTFPAVVCSLVSKSGCWSQFQIFHSSVYQLRWFYAVSNIVKPKHLLNLDLDSEFLLTPLPSLSSILNTEQQQLDRILLKLKIFNSIQNFLVYEYKLILDFYRKSKKGSVLFVILKIFVKFSVRLYLTGWYRKYHPTFRLQHCRVFPHFSL